NVIAIPFVALPKVTAPALLLMVMPLAPKVSVLVVALLLSISVVPVLLNVIPVMDVAPLICTVVAPLTDEPLKTTSSPVIALVGATLPAGVPVELVDHIVPSDHKAPAELTESQ